MGSRRGSMVHGTAAVLAVVLLAVVGCSTPTRTTAAPNTPANGPRSEATLTGRVVGPDGTPRAGVPVAVIQTHTGLVLGRTLEAIFTLGLSCVASPGDCPGQQHQVDSAVTDAAGHYALTLPKAYLPGFQTDEDWIASVGRAPIAGEITGPSSSYELSVATALQQAPDLALWDGTPTVVPTGSQLRVDVPPLSGAPGVPTSVRFVTDAGAVLWQVGGNVDPRLLEDVPSRVVGTGKVDVTVHHKDGRTIYHQTVATGAVPYKGTQVPPSRGAACTLDQSAAVGCPLTDGDLVTGVPHKQGRIATVDLGRREPVGLVVVRGDESADATTVEVSTDGSSWKTLRIGALGGATGVVASSSSNPTVRYVRLSSTTAGQVREVSMWPSQLTCTDICTASSSSGHGGAATAAVAALLLATVGLVLVTRRRRAPGR